MKVNNQFSAIIKDNQLLIKAIESSVTGISIADMQLPDYPLIYINSAFEQLTGYSAPEVLGRNCRFLQADDRDQSARFILRKSLKEGKECKVVLRNYRKDGSMFWNELTMSPVYNNQKELVHFIAMQMDVTKEVEVRKSNEKLAKAIQQRTEELELMVKDLEAFNYSVSHDLRAPLMHITGYADLLKSHSGGDLDPKGQRFLQFILESSKKMGDLIDELLTYSRLGRAEVHTRKVDPEQLIEKCLKELENQTENRQIEFIIGTLPEIEVDSSLFKLVFEHLLSNAIKFTGKEDRAKIQVNCISDDESHVFSITDNGMGFNNRYKEKLFEVFQTLHTKDDFGGTGMGLAIVKKVVVKHGGKVWGESELEDGATFYFSIPANGVLD